VENCMNETAVMPDHSRFDQSLESIGLDLGASETHGVICGLICAGTSQAHIDWIENLFAERPSNDLLVRETRQMLGQLYLASSQQLGDEGVEFALLLPQEEESLQRRAQALTKWCEGFLYGLGMAGIGEQHLVGDAKEALHDIAEFTRLDLDALDEDESSESDYMELQEFLRVAAMLIREDLMEGRNDDQPTQEAH
jgi:uncharacterized protein